MNEDNKDSKKKNLGFLALLGPVILIPFIFLPAGRWNYWQGWVFFTANLITIIITVIVLFDKPDLIRERLKPGKGTKGWDKVYYAVSAPLYFFMIILAGLDAGRYGWSPPLPLYYYILGLVLFFLGHGLFLWAKWHNRFFSSVVRIQTDRGHTVCQEGPYRYVRHPGYVAGILFTLPAPVILGSLWALISLPFLIIPIVIRTYLEDLTLQKELPGYAEYTQKVKYRLLPYLW
jgi:protein-S-isoprenylcysteine O-methyltransferase Ste14